MMKDHEDFKSEMRDELYELRSLLQAQQLSANSTVPVASSLHSSSMPPPY